MHKATRIISVASSTAAALALFACNVGPNYKRPQLDVPPDYKSTAKGEKKRPKLGRNWWRVFNDSELNRLEEATIAANQDVKAAMARVVQARATAEGVRSGFFPVIGLNPAASRSRSARNNSSGTIQTASSTFSDFSIPFDVSYEVDIWGAVRRSYESAKAQTRAAEDAQEVVLQTAEADVAQNYFNLRAFDAQADILHRNVGLYKEQVDLTESQFKAGLANRADVLQAQSLLNATLTQETEAQRQRDDLEHAIAILTGKPPSALSIPVRVIRPSPPAVPAGLPGDLLKRRPDVAQADENLAAASAEIGVATAAFFPTFSLTGSGGFESQDIGKLLNWQSRAWSIGTGIAQPLFQGGKLRANLKLARARFDELAATYRSTLLGAFRDVEDALVDLHRRANESETQSRAVTADRETVDLITKQYRSGLTTYLQVIVVERILLNDELSESQIGFNRMISTVLLIKAAGGGWKE